MSNLQFAVNGSIGNSSHQKRKKELEWEICENFDYDHIAVMIIIVDMLAVEEE